MKTTVWNESDKCQLLVLVIIWSSVGPNKQKYGFGKKKVKFFGITIEDEWKLDSHIW